MTYRTRIIVSFVLAAVLPIAVLAYLIRQEMTRRLTAEHLERVETSMMQTEADLRTGRERITTALSALGTAIINDNRFRRGAVDGQRDDRSYVLDYAERTMRLSGLAMLQIQDDRRRILSSGHFRNEYDRIDRALPDLLPRGEPALTRVRAPDEPFIVLVAADSIMMGGRRFFLVAGESITNLLRERSGATIELEIDPRGDNDSEVVAGISDEGTDIVRDIRLPMVDAQRDSVSIAAIRIRHDMSNLAVLRAGVDRWFLIVVLAAAIIAALVATWIASRISRPISELADKASRIDLDRLNVAFKTDRNDEIGDLSRILRSMIERIRVSAASIREAERRATRGELARQVNHDIKNGIAPVRNVIRHLGEVAQATPENFAAVFGERQATLESGIAYLETLATNYARLTPLTEQRQTDVGEIVRRVTSDFSSVRTVRIGVDTRDGLNLVADPVALRRILENLVANAIASTRSNGGDVLVSAERVLEADSNSSVIRITVADTGEGMTDEELSQAFQDFYTTRERGTGLGLSIVRRLVMDLSGTLRVESKKGEGSRFVVDLPETNGN